MANTGSTPSDGQLIDPAEMDSIRTRLEQIERAGVSPPPSSQTIDTDGRLSRFAVKIISSTTTSSGPEYMVRRMIGGSSSGHSGLVEAGPQEYKARNVADEAGAAGAAFATGTVIVNAYWSARGTSAVILFYAVSPLPSGGTKYQVLMKLDDVGTVGWSEPRFTA